MATARIRKGAVGHLYLKEWRESKGVSAEAMAGRLGIERESVYRIEREQTRARKNQAAYAAALDVPPGLLWQLPSALPSLDAIVADAPEDVKKMVADVVRRMVGKAS